MKRPAIGVAISTYRRNDVLTETLRYIDRYCQGMPVVIVDDGSDDPHPRVTHRHEVNRGVAATKNRGMAELVELGVEHVFLLDDDCFPISPDWWKPYVASPIPHLQYLWGGRIKEQRDGWVARNRFHGCMLYARKIVLDTVGGMRPEFTGFGWDHVEWSRRINAAGLTPHRYMDVDSSAGLWRSLDQDARAGGKPHASSVGPDRKLIAARNMPLLERFTGTTDYVEFREAVSAPGPGLPGARGR